MPVRVTFYTIELMGLFFAKGSTFTAAVKLVRLNTVQRRRAPTAVMARLDRTTKYAAGASD
jgi:hypothetical protein